MRITSLGYVGVEATNLDAWSDFGPNILGLQPSERNGDGALLFRMDERSYRLAVHRGERDGLAYMGWELPTLADLDEAERALEVADVQTRRGGPEECEARQVRALVHCTDPAGNSLELFCGQLTAAHPFQPARPISGFVTGELGLGHVVVGVPDIPAGLRFYVDVLGFRVSDFMASRMAFLHCNPRHHSLALGQMGRVGLNHIMMEVQALDDVGRTYDLCQAKGVEISRSLGRHSNDRMVSFYMESPSGFGIEYGWGGRLVDDATWTVQQIATGSFWGHQPVSERARERMAGMQMTAAPR